MKYRSLSLVLALLLLLLLSFANADNGTWVLNPVNDDWDTAANWSSNTVPGSIDVATFDVSNVTEIVVSAGGNVGAILFTSSADAFQISAPPTQYLVVGSFGIQNNSDLEQTFVAAVDGSGNAGTLQLAFGEISGGPVTLIAQAPILSTGLSGVILLIGQFSAGNTSIVNQGGLVSGGNGGLTAVQEMGSLGTAVVTNEAGTVGGASGGMTAFDFGSGDAGSSIISSKGASVSGASGGSILFQGASDAASSTLIAEAGTNGGGGGTIQFEDSSKGGTSQINVSGNGSLNIVKHNSTAVIVGSLEGDGNVLLGRNLTVGSNNLSTTFSGVIQDTGSLSKTGTGTLTLSGANTYTGMTTVTQGVLLAANTSGSATGTGPISVGVGTLGGTGTISGAVTVGTGSGAGALLAPAFGSNKQVILTLQNSLTLQADATYTYTFKANRNRARTDLVIADGVTINNATIAITGTTQGRMRRGTVLTVISNTSPNPISGTFSNLADAAIVNVNGNNLQASYSGGDGNDLTLTVVP